MKFTKESFITGFALFSMFFGAGNLLLPPMLGYNSGEDWFIVALGFIITAVVIPLLGILAHARLQGTMFDFAKKVSPIFSAVYCIIVYIISVAIPSPRTAAATYETVIQPNFENIGSLLNSTIYFGLVLVFVLNRSKILSLLGKYLTPLIVSILLLVIGIGLFSAEQIVNPTEKLSFFQGLIEGYQTFDAIGAVVIGGVIIISLNLRGHTTFEAKKYLISRSGFIAGFGLLIMYAGMIAAGAYFRSEIVVDQALSSDLQRAQLLNTISLAALGNIGSTFLSFLIGLACFTTAVGITTGTADYFKGLFNDSKQVYLITAIIACLIGVIVGQLNFGTIIHIGLPIIFMIYPITIALIFLNVAPEKFATQSVFRTVVIVTILFSIPDCIRFITNETTDLGQWASGIRAFLPLGNEHFGWVLPALVSFIISNIYVQLTAHKTA
ncbi:branched-chain amino acid transport system II carrier protein [Aquimarina sp. 2201CG5-10]|uniref:branched-chain amino acid transport system II carrier protein n=1 Tax=Aquimarina callyspongiae TaxID=3098150 RepID=UPI002AB4A449|nr:branched-chain amino acid transport system II carrier protein [Aquimarina sp. 2201CG5-10]MDY8135090.1 branched-chain amino acid transport system II carrier protein [Aquimarina sp. 2201CG5-10]